MPHNDVKLKLLIVGSSGCGKSLIANVVSDTIDSEAFGDLRPTQGARILEFLVDNPGLGKVEVELWDCSGDPKFESCWPMMRKGLQGVILVHSPKVTGSQRELNLLYNYFVTQPDLSPKQCVVFFNSDDEFKPPSLSSPLSRISQISVNPTRKTDKLKIDFSNFITSVLNVLK